MSRRSERAWRKKLDRLAYKFAMETISPGELRRLTEMLTAVLDDRSPEGVVPVRE